MGAPIARNGQLTSPHPRTVDKDIISIKNATTQEGYFIAGLNNLILNCNFIYLYIFTLRRRNDRKCDSTNFLLWYFTLHRGLQRDGE